MRNNSSLATLLILIGATLCSDRAFAQAPTEAARNRLTDAHSRSAMVGIDDNQYSDAQRKRIYRLEGEIMCACPKENWSKTLKGCPDGCADRQKAELRQFVEAGDSDEKILQTMVDMYGPQARAAPLLQGTGLWSYLFPFAALGGAAVVVILVARNWRQKAQANPAQGAVGAEAAGVVTDEERLAVEKELEALE